MQGGFDLTMTMTRYFVDRQAMRRAIRDGEARSLPKIGAFVRKRAQTKMLRRRKRVSQPGEPPSVHSNDKIASLKNILFAVDVAGNSVLCGPVKLNQVNMVVDVGSQTVPQIMEFGGVVAMHEEARVDERPWFGDVVWRRRDLRRGTKLWKKYRVRRVTYGARPFMGPALAAEIAAGTIPQSLSGVVRAA